MIFILLFLVSFVQAAQFVFVIPSFNNQECYKKNLDSVFFQSIDDYRVIYIDDASTDHTGDLVESYVEARPSLKEKFTLLRNPENRGALANLYNAVWQCDPNEIVVTVDGDDWLAHRDVLKQLKEVYKDKNVWLTYGQFIYYPEYKPGSGDEVPKEVIQQNSFRKQSLGTSALRTFYAGLFHQIKKEDLLQNGKFFKTGYDLAITIPMLEMAGRHSRFVPQISYVYNIASPINDHKVHIEDQESVDHLIRKKEKYRPLTHYNQSGVAKRVYITPGFWGALFEADNPFYNRDNGLEVLCNLRETAAKKGIELIQADSLEDLEEFEYLVLFDVFLDQLPFLENLPKEKLILFLWEPASVNPENFDLENHRFFSKIYTWDDSLVDNERYFKFYYPRLLPQIKDLIPYSFKRFSTLIACNKYSSLEGELYSERRNLIAFFDKTPGLDFELFGKGWSGQSKNYQGAIDKKVDVLKYYRFCFAYENIQSVPGYITEKIFDCFQAGTVPIYWGAPNISKYIPPGCFIDRTQFESQEALYHYLKTLSESEYEQYMENIRQFLDSDAAKLYSKEHFIQTFMEMIL